jgi:hypothetical protein
MTKTEYGTVVLTHEEVVHLLKEGGQEMPYSCFRTEGLEYIGQGRASAVSMRCHYFYRSNAGDLYYTFTQLSCA